MYKFFAFHFLSFLLSNNNQIVNDRQKNAINIIIVLIMHIHDIFKINIIANKTKNITVEYNKDNNIFFIYNDSKYNKLNNQ